MKSSFLIFFAIVLTIYGLVNFYIFIRGWHAIPQSSYLRSYYLVIFLVLSLSYLSGRILERYWMSFLSDALTWAGSFWLAAMVYFLFLVLLIDILRLINIFAHFLPENGSANYSDLKLIVFLFSVLIISLTVSLGYINARNPVINKLELSIQKKAGHLKELNIAMVSDIHLGTIIGADRFNSIVEKINELNSDIVLLAGDIVDEDIQPVIRHNLGETLKNIKSKYGVFGITGNHEYIGGADNAIKYLMEHNVIMLRDTSIKIDNSFYIIGREDRSKRSFTGVQRKSLEELMAGIDKNLPVLVMNHQPFEFDEVVQSGADLHLSGHTHHGQLWPFNYITQKIYEISRGYLKKGNTHFFVSAGAGTWGPPIRLGNRPEIVNIKLKFEE
ncbi:MAG TPA: metallophosphoesterase [Ignavibacteria bacterium]